MSKPSISVLITYHNEGALLTRCLRSFLDQPVCEIVVCDDASSLPPDEFIPTAAFPIRTIRNEVNLGPAKSRNRLLSESLGDFVHFHDSDDWVLPTWGEKVLERVCEGYEVVFSEVSSFKKGELYAQKVQGLQLSLVEDPAAFAIGHFLLVPSGTYQKDLLERIGGYPTQLWQSEDYYFHVRLLAREPKIAVILEPLVGLDLRDESRSQEKKQVWGSTLEALRRLESELPSRYRPAISDAAFRAGSNLYAEGAIELAREAFGFAYSVGCPNIHRNALYRWLARIDPILAERVGRCYRNLIPRSLRDKLQKLG